METNDIPKVLYRFGELLGSEPGTGAPRGQGASTPSSIVQVNNGEGGPEMAQSTKCPCKDLIPYTHIKPDIASYVYSQPWGSGTETSRFLELIGQATQTNRQAPGSQV